MEEESVDRRRKRNILFVFIVFMGLLVFFTLFSNTLHSLTLPKVRTEKAANGSFNYTFEGSGVLEPFAEVSLSNPAGWRASEVLVHVGDRVKKGQKLIIYDSKSAERELEDEISNLDKQKIELQNIQDLFIVSAIEGDELKIRSARRDIEMRKLDLGTQERKINELEDRLISQREMIAPFDGVVTSMNAIEGLAASGAPEAIISNSSLGYRLDMTADSRLLSSLGVTIGGKLQVEVHTAEELTRMIEGSIDEVTNVEPRIVNPIGEGMGRAISIPQNAFRVRVSDSELKGGEQVWIKLEKRSRQEGLVISNEAIHHDRDGMIIYIIDEHRGALGNEFVVRKVLIQSNEVNDKVTLIQADNMYEGDRIILESSEPLQDGIRVRLQ